MPRAPTRTRHGSAKTIFQTVIRDSPLLIAAKGAGLTLVRRLVACWGVGACVQAGLLSCARRDQAEIHLPRREWFIRSGISASRVTLPQFEPSKSCLDKIITQ